ncbi:MAG: hypothetical protein VKS61_02625 [Candidatus Sericytochromatia bacterium]|nr:hypothetical protein [Candidatus Sericytochromatia bacterium]
MVAQIAWQPAVQAAATRVAPATWDARRGEIVIPYTGKFPLYRVVSDEPRHVVIEFAAAPSMMGVFSADAPTHPVLRDWVLRHEGVDRVRLSLTLLEAGRVTMLNDAARRVIVVGVVPAAPRPAPTPVAPAPVPTAEPQPSPTPTAAPTARPQPSPTPTAAPTARPQPSPTPTAAPTTPPQPSPTPIAVPTARLQPSPAPNRAEASGLAPAPRLTPGPLATRARPGEPVLAEAPGLVARGPAEARPLPWVLPARVWRVSMATPAAGKAARSASPPVAPPSQPSGAVSPPPAGAASPAASQAPPASAAPPAARRAPAAASPSPPGPVPAASLRPTPGRPSAGPARAPTHRDEASWLWSHRGVLWLVPGGQAAGPAVRPAGGVESTGWLGPWGAFLGVTVFGETYAPSRLTPYLQAGTPMVDFAVRRRLEAPGFHLQAGYRGLGLANLNFATVGLGLSRVTPWPWLRVEARGVGGHNLGGGSSWRSFLDGQLLLTAHGRVLGLSLGLRHLSLMSAVEPTVSFTGPVLGVRWDL